MESIRDTFMVYTHRIVKNRELPYWEGISTLILISNTSQMFIQTLRVLRLGNVSLTFSNVMLLLWKSFWKSAFFFLYFMIFCMFACGGKILCALGESYFWVHELCESILYKWDVDLIKHNDLLTLSHCQSKLKLMSMLWNDHLFPFTVLVQEFFLQHVWRTNKKIPSNSYIPPETIVWFSHAVHDLSRTTILFFLKSFFSTL